MFLIQKQCNGKLVYHTWKEELISEIQTGMRDVGISGRSFHFNTEILKRYKIMSFLSFHLANAASFTFLLLAAITCQSIESYTISSDTQLMNLQTCASITLTQRVRLRLSHKSNGLCHMTTITVNCVWHHAAFV